MLRLQGRIWVYLLLKHAETVDFRHETGTNSISTSLRCFTQFHGVKNEPEVHLAILMSSKYSKEGDVACVGLNLNAVDKASRVTNQ